MIVLTGAAHTAHSRQRVHVRTHALDLVAGHAACMSSASDNGCNMTLASLCATCACRIFNHAPRHVCHVSENVSRVQDVLNQVVAWTDRDADPVVYAMGNSYTWDDSPAPQSVHASPVHALVRV